MITSHSAKGRRQYQEDRHFVMYSAEGILMGVFDGYGGDVCADMLAQKFPHFWSAIDGDNYSKALAATFRMAESLTDDYHSGSTASVVFIPTHAVFAHVAVLGDSPVIVEKPDGSIWVGPDHNARSNAEERSAAILRGGFYESGYMWNLHGADACGLQMTRAFGDFYCRSFLNRRPEIHTVPLGSFLLVGSDGLFDPTHTKNEITNIAEFINSGRGSATAQDLVKRAVELPTNDNATAILWRR